MPKGGISSASVKTLISPGPSRSASRVVAVSRVPIKFYRQLKCNPDVSRGAVKLECARTDNRLTAHRPRRRDLARPLAALPADCSDIYRFSSNRRRCTRTAQFNRFRRRVIYRFPPIDSRLLRDTKFSFRISPEQGSSPGRVSPLHVRRCMRLRSDASGFRLDIRRHKNAARSRAIFGYRAPTRRPIYISERRHCAA
ncbi:hypothetical protein EVAR_468_1 [Eumeta japonica]|uniref:Uncharacterized protein n=1 Tax=Eumeta variegata TaxID=151549 RepID=A0A4C1SCM8_EUMVA|nr:hypothetical protein EVAR_468_1 [Eumeta japonica]